MRIARLHVVRFRSIVNETLECEALTVLIGRNGAGKSSFLQALRLFLDPSANVSIEDYYDRQDKEEILIEVTFNHLTSDELTEFKGNIDSGVLVVQRRFPSGQYYGLAVGCPEFEALRDKARRKVKVAEQSEDLEKLVKTGDYPGLNAVKRQVEDELSRWEMENPSRCKKYFRSGIFQGPTNIAGGTLRARTHFVYVAPVREAEVDASGSSKQSPLGTLVSPLVNAVTEKNEGVATAKAALLKGYGTYKSLVVSAPEKVDLESQLTNLLRRYDSEAGARIQLGLDETLTLPSPKPKVWLVEDGFEGDVARKGHGLQRLFIFTILELYEKVRAEGGSIDGTIVLAVEEPELYQHPARARSIARTLRDLCYPAEGTGLQFQVFITTHSPYFVDLENFQSLRRIEKVSCAGGPMETKIQFTTLADVGGAVLKAYSMEGKATENSSWARMKSILGIKGSEGFFTNAVILVEGQEDEAILTAYADFKKVSLDRQGVSIIPAEGKTNIARLYVLYDKLGIPAFVIFDGDGNETNPKKAQTDSNKALLYLLGQKPEERPENRIFDGGAVWKNHFAETIKAELGDTAWNESYQKACEEYSMSTDKAKKNFAVVRRTVGNILEGGKSSESLENLWKAITSRCHLA